jgi:hypothetical protein
MCAQRNSIINESSSEDDLTPVDEGVVKHSTFLAMDQINKLKIPTAATAKKYQG